jgi:hypothetical protein
MPIRVNVAEQCDARDDYSSNAVDEQIVFHFIFLFRKE